VSILPRCYRVIPLRMSLGRGNREARITCKSIWDIQSTLEYRTPLQELTRSKGKENSKAHKQRYLTNNLRVRFAAPPTGSLRWQAPQAPLLNRSSPIQANKFGPQCPQSPLASGTPVNVTADLSNEDCLYLNVYSPVNASNLPVLVWIHGGGYGAGNGQENLSPIILANNNSFVGVSIQYRVICYLVGWFIFVY
jgi:carboxylesterase type B